MPTSLGEQTYSVSGLCTEIQEFFRHGYPPIWVAGEVQRLRSSQRGHAYFELVEKGERDDILGRLDGVIWRSSVGKLRQKLAAAGEKLTEGQQIRCLARLDFYGPSGRLQLVVNDIDPVFTLGKLEQRRRETLALLEARDLLDANRQLPFPELPMRVGLVTSNESAAFHDFVSVLQQSPYGFEVVFIHSDVQGPKAAASLSSAIRSMPGLGVDCTVVIRGGGARSDLASFDQLEVAEAIAVSRLPVVTGLGHETDDSICDRVAHTRARTPTGAAELLLDRVRQQELALARAASEFERLALDRLRRAASAVVAAEGAMRLASRRLQESELAVAVLSRSIVAAARQRLLSGGQSLGRLDHRLVFSAPRQLQSQSATLERHGRTIVQAARAKIRWTRERLEGHARLCQELSPHRILGRGFSITRDALGRAVRSSAALAPGSRITTELEDGRVRSIVEDSDPGA